MVCVEFYRTNKHFCTKSYLLKQAASIKDVATHHPVPPEGQLQGSDASSHSVLSPECYNLALLRDSKAYG